MKNKIVPYCILLSLSFSAYGAPIPIESVTYAAPTVGDVTVDSITTADGTFISFGGYSVIGTVGNANDEVFYQVGTTAEPLNQTVGIADGLRVDTGGLNVTNVTLQFTSGFNSDTLLFIFDVGGLDTFTINAVDITNSEVGNPLNITTAAYGGDVDPSNLLNLDRKDNDQDPASALGNLPLQGFSIALSDFTGDLSNATGIRITDGSDGVDLAGFGVAVIPEPSTYAVIIGLATVGLALIRRRGK